MVADPRIYLSPPHMGGLELELVQEAFQSNWIAPLGPHVDAFENEFADAVGCSHALALCSGTAAVHLALRVLGVGPGDEVVVPSLTFCASVNPVLYLGATPVLVDSELRSWNMDPVLLQELLEERAQADRLPRAVVAVDLYGQTADYDAIRVVCRTHGVPLVEDAAEALGATHGSNAAGSLGKFGIFSFNGNKIITTSGGGMLVSDDSELIGFARLLSAQAREPVPHFEHRHVGYNYRLSNVLAAIGRGQLRVLEERVATRRRIFDRYSADLGDLPGVAFMPEAGWGRSNRWLTCLTIDPQVAGTDCQAVHQALEASNIESRPLWKPMHLQPVFAGVEMRGGAVAERLFEQGLCLPSGSSLSTSDLDRIVTIVRSVFSMSRKG